MAHHEEQEIANALAESSNAMALAQAWLQEHGASIPAGESVHYDVGAAGLQLVVRSGWTQLSTADPMSFFSLSRPGP